MELQRKCNIRFISSELTMDLLTNVCRLILRITVLIVVLAAMSTAGDRPLRVFLLDSLQKGLAVDVFKVAFVSSLRTQSPEPLSFYEFSMPTRLGGDEDERSFLGYLRSTSVDQQPDLIVTIGGTAAEFSRKYRGQLFPSTPLLFAAVDERFLDNTVTPNSTAVAFRLEPSRMIETILQVLPGTKNVIVVVGRTLLEQFWREALGREFKRF